MFNSVLPWLFNGVLVGLFWPGLHWKEVCDGTHPETATKSNGFRRIIGLSSHCIRLMDVDETGLRMYLVEKKARKVGCRTRPDTFSGPV